MAAEKKRTRRGGDERRDDLVRAAFACLSADGFEGLRTRSLPDRAGGIAEGVFRRDLDPVGGAAFFAAAMMGAGVLEHPRHELDGIFAVIEAWLLAPRAKRKAAKA